MALFRGHLITIDDSKPPVLDGDHVGIEDHGT